MESSTLMALQHDIITSLNCGFSFLVQTVKGIFALEQVWGLGDRPIDS